MSPSPVFSTLGRWVPEEEEEILGAAANLVAPPGMQT